MVEGDYEFYTLCFFVFLTQVACVSDPSSFLLRLEFSCTSTFDYGIGTLRLNQDLNVLLSLVKLDCHAKSAPHTQILNHSRPRTSASSNDELSLEHPQSTPNKTYHIIPTFPSSLRLIAYTPRDARVYSSTLPALPTRVQYSHT